MDPFQPVQQSNYKNILLALAGCLVAFLIAFGFLWKLQKDVSELKQLYANQQKTLSDYRVYQPYWDFVKKNIDEQAKQPQQPPQGQNDQPNP